MITTEQIKELREKTGAPIIDCKQALTEARGNLEKAIEELRIKGLASLKNKAGRAANEGAIDSYIHAGGKIGVLVEINCETDFVAKSDKFKEFVHNVALHVAAADPLYVNVEDVPQEVLEKERQIYLKEAKKEAKPDNVVEKIIEGKLKKYFDEVVLINQAYVKDPDITINEYLGSIAASLGENIKIGRFVRIQLGQS